MLKYKRIKTKHGDELEKQYTPIGRNLEILVVEDKEKHLEGIKALEAEGHTVTVAKDYIAAQKFLYGDYKKETKAKKYDVVLTDLMFPMGGEPYEEVSMGDNDKEKRSAENALGYAIVLAAAQKKIPYVAVVTDMNHHQNPIAATFDMIGSDKVIRDADTDELTYYSRRSFKIDDSKVLFFDIRDLKCGDDGMKDYKQVLHLLFNE